MSISILSHAHWIINAILAFVIAIVCSGILIPQILLISFRKKLFDSHDDRKIHQGVVPRLGGIAFFPVILFTVALLAGINITFTHEFEGPALTRFACNSLFGTCGGLMLYLIGMADDLVGVRYSAKFFVQILAGCLMVASGLWLNSFDGFLWIEDLSPWVGMPLSILLFVFITNAINLIDGIDGLASGLSAIALLFYGIFFLYLSAYPYAIISFASLGVVIQFFYYNVFGDVEKHKKIFMGDTGALTLGFILCFLALTFFVIRIPEGTKLPNNAILAFSPLLVPCLDVVRVFARRIRKHGNPFLPDRTHIHHKLLNLGMPKGLTMITILLVSIFFIVLNLILTPHLNITWIFIIDLTIWTVANQLINKRLKDLGRPLQ
ncbi:MAG: undecaprenyl/decaprenyl-phosphate alpha-N-acetylglucosaminyl 1-phosphate transferase [Muribaculum sp.]|nr:undecaprenyl/decaprenyl-phosphate alpha-N-acetylglucosaminyl 1-phosphate transferase [Muribaculum sp.]